MRSILYFLCSLLLFSGCTSVVERMGRVLDGSHFDERKIESYKTDGIELSVVRNREEERFIIITLDNFPMMRLRGSYPDEENQFYFISMEYLSGSHHGWNEFTLELLGEGKLIFENGASLEINDDLEKVQISSGRIHRHDTRITGNDALTALRNRHERIFALTEWMKKSNEDAPQNQTLDNFENYWKPILFPETVKRRNRPQDWQIEDDTFARAEDINWNTSYTERVFSEELKAVRNSGTMLRDWEEAISWIYLYYEWENIVHILSRKNELYHD